MVQKVVIAPVGIYEERVWKSILRSGAQKVYLIYDKKPEYEITRRVAKDLAERVVKTLMIEAIELGADFADLEDIYRVLIFAIEKERRENPFVEIVLDTTASTKKGWHAAANIANAYGYVISYVPGRKKVSKNIVEKRYQLEKDDLGDEVEILQPALSIPSRSPLSEDEIAVLCKLKSKMYSSITQLIDDIVKERGTLKDNSVEKRFLRVVRDLEEKKLLISEKGNGRTKSIQLTREGRGVATGLSEIGKTLRL
jgi:hypothetical protein